MSNPKIKIKTGDIAGAYANDPSMDGITYLNPLENGELGYNAWNNGLYIGYNGTNYLLSVLNGEESQTFYGVFNGNADSADKLRVAKSIQTDLASTSSAYFNGSKNITPGVTGTLSIANGGTGATTAANALINLGALALTGGTVTGPTAFGSTLTVNGVATFSNTTASSSTTTGAVKISGGLGVGGSVYADKVYNAVWNDYAELFPRGEETEPGDIIALNETAEEEKYIKAIKGHKALVGVHSDEYGHLIGGENCSIEENLQKYIPVGLAGRVWVKVHDEPSLGDYITASEIPGVGEKTNNRNQAIGIVVSKKQNGKVKIKII